MTIPYWFARLTLERFALFLAAKTFLRQSSRPARIEDVGHGLAYSRPVDSRLLLAVTKLLCYSGKDLRAAWLVDGRPRTTVARYEPLANWAREHWAMYFSFIEKYEPQGEVLDLGCGIGNMTASLALALPTSKVVGLDLNRKGIELGKLRFQLPNLELEQGDALDASYESRFDYAFCVEVLEHVHSSQHDKLVEAAINALRPGGLLFLTTPNARNELDHSWGHIGLLNSLRAKAFFERHERLIREFGYLDNTNLDSLQSATFLHHSDRLQMVSGEYPQWSHFWVVMQKPHGGGE